MHAHHGPSSGCKGRDRAHNRGRETRLEAAAIVWGDGPQGEWCTWRA